MKRERERDQQQTVRGVVCTLDQFYLHVSSDNEVNCDECTRRLIHHNNNIGQMKMRRGK